MSSAFFVMCATAAVVVNEILVLFVLRLPSAVLKKKNK